MKVFDNLHKVQLLLLLGTPDLCTLGPNGIHFSTLSSCELLLSHQRNCELGTNYIPGGDVR